MRRAGPGTKLMVAPIRDRPKMRIETPKVLFDRTDLLLSNHTSFVIDAAPDGQHFVALVRNVEAYRQLNVILNWTSELERLVPTDN